ncbi:hypothetical protein GJ496_010116 [Pomphorhynchus laevis]|nr:hypothetical protein GJ496_010116 [Pomphorhynchus laevis]
MHHTADIIPSQRPVGFNEINTGNRLNYENGDSNTVKYTHIPIEPSQNVNEKQSYDSFWSEEPQKSVPPMIVNTNVQNYNTDYLKSVLGIIRIVRMVCHALGFICASSTNPIIAHLTGYLWARYVYQGYSIYGLVFALIMFSIFYLNWQKRGLLERINWVTIDILYCLEMFVIFFMLSTVCCLWERQLGSNFIINAEKKPLCRRGGPGFAAFFGFIASGTYIVEIIWKYLKITRS